jgi:DNA-binding MarR family transcriptional regulator
MKTSDCKFSKCLYFTSNALARKVEKLAIESWKPVDLSPSHGYLLLLVLEEPGIQPGTIANQLQLTPSTISRLIEKLEERKLVVRTTEGKTTNVYPSPKAKQLLPELQACVSRSQAAYLESLGNQDIKNLVKNMNLISDQLSE